MLVEHGHDPATDRRFLRLIGGGIEFGERAEDAGRREWMEELGAELADVRLLDVLEDFLEHAGRVGHEIVFLFEASLANFDRFARDEIELVEADGSRHVASWVSIDALSDGPLPFVPKAAARWL